MDVSGTVFFSYSKLNTRTFPAVWEPTIIMSRTSVLHQLKPGAALFFPSVPSQRYARTVTPVLYLVQGLDLEEARMLEAAMLGIPYAGRIPDFANMQQQGNGGYGGGGGGGGGGVVDPNLQEQRMLQQEQNAAFEQSLEV